MEQGRGLRRPRCLGHPARPLGADGPPDPGAYHHVGEPIYDYYLSHELSLAISVAASRGAHVVLLTAPYTHRAERPDGGLYDEDQPARVDAWNRLLYAAAAQDPQRVSVIDLNARVCPDHTFTWNIDGLRIRSDGLHFTEVGVEQWIAPWLLPQLADVALGEPVNPAAAITPAPASPLDVSDPSCAVTRPGERSGQVRGVVDRPYGDLHHRASSPRWTARPGRGTAGAGIPPRRATPLAAPA